ncbi:MAG TPA: UDP-N-acetylmuramate dehydrogenase [Candidatus Sulfotelmatobacter sp.]|nr:UDP-N-acetylmuramate dehydrogenase [Candidatus Sulfotelmatobacter sp.]
MIRQNVSLKNYSNYKIGGNASYFLEVNSRENLLEGLREWENKGKIFVLGKGTNILISEEGFEGLVIHNNILGIEKNEEKVTVGAGVLVSDFLNFCIENSLSGFEWAGGLPGTVGGAVRGNAGAFKGETKDSVDNVTSINLNTLKEITRKYSDLEFGYRKSIFKKSAPDEIIISVVFKLKKGEKDLIRNAVIEKIDYRNLKHPMDKPSIGSTFKNIPVDKVPLKLMDELKEYVKDDPFPVVPVAKLLFLCDLKGKREGDAQISEKHPNFIVNLGNAKYKDVVFLINFAREKVKEKFGLELEEEIMYL